MMQMPYFLQKKEWYKAYISKKTGNVRYELTDKAPPEAVESYKRYIEAKKEAEKGLFDL